jgi:DNA-binding response OmpR family regulator
VKRGIEAGASDYFTKPVELPTLIARIKELIPPKNKEG